MAKFLALLLATAASITLTQASCAPDAILCGTTIMNVLQCKYLTLLSADILHTCTIGARTTVRPDTRLSMIGENEGDLTLITPAGNDPQNCAFKTDALGTPQGNGAFCCADGRCLQMGRFAYCY